MFQYIKGDNNMKKLFKEINQDDIRADKNCKVDNSILSSQINLLNIEQNMKSDYEDSIQNCCRDYVDKSELEMLIEQMNLIGILVI